MTNIPPWIKAHKILGSKANRLDPAAWLIAADWHEDRGEHAMADSVRGKARLFAAIMEAIGRLSSIGQKIKIGDFHNWAERGDALVRMTKRLVILRVRKPDDWDDIADFRFEIRLCRANTDYLPSRLVNEVLA